MTSSSPSLKTWQRTPPAFSDVDKFAESVTAYFIECQERKIVPNHVELATFLGVPQRTLWEYKRKPGFDYILMMAKQQIEGERVRMLFDKNTPTAGVIFDLVNNYGWKQPNQIEHSGSIAVAHSQVPPDVQNEIDSHRAEIEGE